MCDTGEEPYICEFYHRTSMAFNFYVFFSRDFEFFVELVELEFGNWDWLVSSGTMNSADISPTSCLNCFSSMMPKSTDFEIRETVSTNIEFDLEPQLLLPVYYSLVLTLDYLLYLRQEVNSKRLLILVKIDLPLLNLILKNALFVVESVFE